MKLNVIKQRSLWWAISGAALARGLSAEETLVQMEEMFVAREYTEQAIATRPDLQAMIST